MRTNKKRQIALYVKNNTPYQVGISLMGNLASPAAPQINARRETRWNLKAETYIGATTVTIEVKTNFADPFTTISKPLPALNLEGVLLALNSMGLGSFTTYDNGISAFVITFNDVNIYGDIIIT